MQWKLKLFCFMIHLVKPDQKGEKTHVKKEGDGDRDWKGEQKKGKDKRRGDVGRRVDLGRVERGGGSSEKAL